MNILSLKSKKVYDITANRRGENYMACPECNDERKHKNRKSFSWNTHKETGYCHNCEASFVPDRPREAKQYIEPKPINNTQLTDSAVSFFEGRMIAKDTLNKQGIFSAIEWMPQFGSEIPVICFPYYRNGKLVNIKYRGANKSFKLVKDAELIFYNLDSLINNDYCIITEGEMDALSFVQTGLTQVVSVPNGAKGSNLIYLDNTIDIFQRIEKIYIAVDTDAKGIELRDELTRRLGPEKCHIIEYEGYKDANEALQHGVDLYNCYNKSRPATVEGLIDINEHYSDLLELYRNGLKPGCKLDIPELDKLITWELGRLAVVTGVPGHGKSEFVDFVISKLNCLYNWKTAYFSPENYPMKYHLMKLIPKIAGKKFHPDTLKEQELNHTFNYISDNFQFIAPDDDQTFERIIELATIAVKRNGIKVLVIDPYNKIEHKRDKSETETEYISRFLDKLITFAKFYNVLVVLVAHPRKMPLEKEGGQVTVPTLYDINGSANFYNKADYGITVYRDRTEEQTFIHIQKVKFRHLGEGGTTKFTYNYHNGRYENPDLPMANWSRSNWVLDKLSEQIKHDAIQPNNDFLTSDDECPF